MLTTDGKWKRVKPVRGGVTINCGALMAQITKKYIKATIHRVAPPPEDQYGQERLGLLYFACFNVCLIVSRVLIVTHIDS